MDLQRKRLFEDDDFEGQTRLKEPPLHVADGTPSRFYSFGETRRAESQSDTRVVPMFSLRGRPRPVRPSPRPNVVRRSSRELADLVATAPFVRPFLEPREVALDAVNQELATATSIESAPPEPAPVPYAAFDKIGLGPKRVPSTVIAKAIVKTYRWLGFAILTTIVIAIVGYIAITLFYVANHNWIVPSVLSANDERVVARRGELAVLQNERDRLGGELADTERVMTGEQAYQTQLVAAIASDLAGRRSALRRVRALAGAAAATREEIRAANAGYAEASAARIGEQYNAGMIDRHALLDGKHQLAQLTSSNLSLAERQAAFETQASELSRQTKELDALVDNRAATLSYDVLAIKRDLDASKLAVAKATERRGVLLASLARQDQLITALRGSAYLRAIADNATIALVPYSNLGPVHAGTPVFACKLEMVWCSEVGSVVEVLPGEVPLRHPHRDSQLRGQMISLRLTDTSAGRDNVLFVGSKPVGF